MINLQSGIKYIIILLIVGASLTIVITYLSLSPKIKSENTGEKNKNSPINNEDNNPEYSITRINPKSIPDNNTLSDEFKVLPIRGDTSSIKRGDTIILRSYQNYSAIIGKVLILPKDVIKQKETGVLYIDNTPLPEYEKLYNMGSIDSQYIQKLSNMYNGIVPEGIYIIGVRDNQKNGYNYEYELVSYDKVIGKIILDNK